MAKVSWTHDQAVEVLRLCRQAELSLNQIVVMAQDAKLPEEEFNIVWTAFGKIVGEKLYSLEDPIYATYPDLLPDYLDLSKPAPWA